MSSTNQRGKNVVSASSGYTTSSTPCPAASCSRSIIRATTCLRLSSRCTGPSCAAATVRTRDTGATPFMVFGLDVQIVKLTALIAERGELLRFFRRQLRTIEETLQFLVRLAFEERVDDTLRSGFVEAAGFQL